MTSTAMEEYELMKDAKYRMYVAAIDKALKNFEYTSEWADLISALGKLNKVLLSYTKFPIIPRRIKISKRLAQCMHPALPSGVHLKALETYDIIFRCMGTNRLSHELFIYSAGLFPLLGHAAMNIRPTLLTIYESHFVPLRERLRPALSGFLSGVLPGLETGSDHFERTNTLLENICDGVGGKYFYTCIWQCVTNNSPVRLPAISYVLTHYSRKVPMEDQLFLMGHDIDLMVCGLCAAVQDSSVLVQRSALDLLMLCFPMHNNQLLYADMVRLVTAALSTILRRDMSLNRRLYSWLVETDAKTHQIVVDHDAAATSDHQNTIAYDLLNDAIRIILKKSCLEVPLDIKPYRLLTSLFDKPQIGPVILDNILYDLFRTLYLSCLEQQKPPTINGSGRCVSFNGDLTSLKDLNETVLNKQFVTKKCQELVKHANLLFNTLQSYYIWSYIEKLYTNSVETIENCKSRDRCQVCDIGTGPPHILEICILTDFLLDIIPIESYADNTSNILPNLFNKIITALRLNISTVNPQEIESSLKLCTKILTKIQPITVTQVKESDTEDQEKNETESKQIAEASTESPRTTALEKSKSDSKINENFNKNELTIDESSRERSYSNQMLLKKKEKTSPKIEKKSKNKKSKSSPKLYDLNKNEASEDDINVRETIADKVAPEPQKTAKIENKYFINCLEEYKQFYVTFIKNKIIPEVDLQMSLEKLLCNKDEHTNRLIKLLEDCLIKRSEFVPIDFECLITKNDILTAKKHLSTENISCEYESAMNVASNILLEFSAFPNLIDGNLDEEHLIPLWLQALIVSACCKSSSREIQITSMNTLLEIFSLARNQNFVKKDDANTNIFITGILQAQHVHYVEDNTIVIEEMSKILWNLLGILNNQKQILLCVTLLYQIHNTFESKSFVEQVINKFLSSDHLATSFMKQFFLLWHLGRDLTIKLPPNMSNIRNFDRSLLKIFDNLQNADKPNLQLLAESFLTHSLLHEDIPRLINPILLKLLAGNTARVSIRHVNINDSDSQSDITVQENQKVEEYHTKKIYAVSSQNGNIMYHLAHDQQQKPNKRKWFTFSKTGKKFSPSVVNMTTTVMDDFNIVTRKNKDFKNIGFSPRLDKSASRNMKVIINPLSSKEIYSDGVDGSYAKLEAPLSRRSSSESLSSNGGTDRDSGYDSLIKNRNQLEMISTSSAKILESIEPISDGIVASEATPLIAAKIPKSHSFDEKRCAANNDEMENSLVHSWSYCISDSDHLNAEHELEISTSAEEFFNRNDNAVVTEIMNEIIEKVCGLVDHGLQIVNRPTDLDLKQRIPVYSSKNCMLYPIHSHICLYYDVFDSNQVIYALHTLKSCILSNPQLFIKCLATSGIKNLKNNEILNLLARHRKSLLGYNFNGDLNPEYANFYRGYMFLDVIITVCLNYARTFYPFLEELNVTEQDLNNNLKIQLDSLEILDIIVKNLIKMVNENSKGFANYIGDMLIKCKLQKIMLHCLLTSVRNFDEEMTFAEEVLLFNSFQLYDSKHRVGEHVEAFQIQLLRLINSLIVLEYYVFSSSKPSAPAQEPTTPSAGDLNYTPTVLIPQQNIFLSAVMSALRHKSMKNLHEKWLNMITSCLPYFGENIKQISISVIHQICNNLEEIAAKYTYNEIEGEICTDYGVTQLESLTILCHYCLLDSSQSVNQTNLPNNPSTPISNPGEIFNNLVSAFFAPVGLDMNATSKTNSDYYQNARKTILSHMPRIISSVAKLWQTIVNLENDNNGIYGNSKVVKQQLLEFLSPIAVNHGATFLAAIAVAWYERRNLFSSVKTVLPEPNAGQNNLVYLISAIRVIPLDNLVQTVTAVIKNPPPTEGLCADICLDVSVLELFYCYMRNASPTQLTEAWSSLLALIREGCSLTPPAQFLLVALLHELMIKCCPLEERKDQKDLQDVTAKLIESVSQVCGSCLEQTTWLRRNLAVKESDEDTTPDASINGASSEIVVGNSHSVQAQLVLSEILAPILDICFGSSEKDKVVTILTSLMYNIVPYLKTHTMKNMPSFQACSKLLAGLSSYQYTRKAWKKDVFELLLDNTLFQMDYNCLKYWKIIVDNLMTHDNTTFRDLMSRVSLTQSGSLSIFSSREQEYEQRAQLLKRLAYVIFCSEMDQYAKYMPDIQEQLTSSLRLNVPGVQAQVFLCFRVILIRMSPMQVTSLWPIIISEMLQVFLQIEQELLTDSEEFRTGSSFHIKLLSSLDASWSTNSNNGLHALGHPHWLRLQLATAKLLDLSLLLPALSLPQFQMYRWAFVGDDLEHLHSSSVSFTPHVVRIANLMDKKFTDSQIETLPMKRNELLLTMNSINQLKDLHSFFKTLTLSSNRHRTECSKASASDYSMNDRHSDKQLNMVLEKIDKIIEMDFLDKIPR